MKTLYLECFSGMSGNMFLAALLELGVEFDYLKQELSKLHLDDEFELVLSKMDKNGIAASYIDVVLKKECGHSHEHEHAHGECAHSYKHEHAHAHGECGHSHSHEHVHGECAHSHEHEHAHGECSHSHSHEHTHGECGHSHEHTHGEYSHSHSHSHEHAHAHGECAHSHSHEHEHSQGEGVHSHSHVHRNLYDIYGIIENSDLSLRVQELAKSVFGFVARAEGRVHGKPLNEVHFHEVGAIDSIVDIVGAAICIQYLGIERVVSSQIATGTGFVRCAHGLMPLPAPATLEILKEAAIPFYAAQVKGELLTPTGAAILAAFVNEYGNMPRAKLLGIGYGAGKRDHEVPNVVRAALFEEKEESAKALKQEVAEIRFQIDDMTGEELGFFMELVLAEGARDIYYQPIFMKKNRPATAITILLDQEQLPYFADLIFKHTSTLGFRYMLCPRKEMDRQNLESSLNGEPYRVKIAQWRDIQKISYEYEDIKRIALTQDKTLQEVLNEISFSVFESIRRQEEDPTNHIE